MTRSNSKHSSSTPRVSSLENQVSTTLRQKDGTYLVKNGQVGERLANFSARIVEQIEISGGDGLIRRLYLLKVRVFPSGGQPKELEFEVDAARFESMEWVPLHLGADALVSSAPRAKSILALGFLQQSKNKHLQRRIREYGFTKVDQVPVFIHPKGVITAKGMPDGTKITPVTDASFKDFGFSDEPIAEERKNGLMLSPLRLLKLSPRNPAIGVILLASAIRSVTHGFHASTVTPFIIGRTGTYKSSAAALAQGLFGRAFDTNNPPVTFTGTTMGIDRILTRCRHMLLVCDDYYPGQANKAANEQLVEHVIFGSSTTTRRAVALNSTTLAPTEPICTTPLVTGEVPLQTEKLSRHARVLYCPLEEGDVQRDTLWGFQKRVRRGVFELAMRLFIEDALDRFEKLEKQAPKRYENYRDRARRELPEDLHSRMAANIADMMLGIELYLDYCERHGCISKARKERTTDEAWQALLNLAREQETLRERYMPAGLFNGELRRLLRAGRYHLRDVSGRPPATKPQARLGWHDREPSGPLLGFVDFEAKRVYIPATFDPQPLLAAMPSPVRAAFMGGRKAFWKRMEEHGLLVEHEPGRNTVRKVIAGQKTTVYAISLSSLMN